MIPSYLVPALAAYLLLALASSLDKVLLRTVMTSPRAYAFYVGVLSTGVVVLLPFGVVSALDLRMLLASLLSGVTGVYALWSFYSALKEHEASRVITTVGALVPVFTLIFSIVFLNEQLIANQLLAFALLVVGGVLISYEENVEKAYTLALFGHAARSAVLFAGSFTLLRLVYLSEPFLNGLFWTKLGCLLGSLSIIAIPENRKRIFWATKKVPKRAPLPFVLNQVLGGGGGILQNYAISLGSATLVGALQGAQYAFLLVLIVLLSRYFPQLREEFGWRAIVQKALAVIMVGIGLVVLVGG